MADRVAIILAAGVSSRMNTVRKTSSPNVVKADRKTSSSTVGCPPSGVPRTGDNGAKAGTPNEVEAGTPNGVKAGTPNEVKAGTPKVLHEVCGRPMLGYVLDTCRQAGINRMYVVVGYGADKVKQTFDGDAGIIWVYQAEQLGTAHAVLCCREHLKDFDGQTFVLCGDGPLIRPEVLKELIETHNSGSAAVLATAILDDPTGYGRIARDSQGNIEAIVEHNDCTDEQLKIREVNPSYYLFDNKLLFEALENVEINEKKGEYYLTDAIEILIKQGHKVSAITALRAEEAMSVNTVEQLEQLDRIMSKRLGIVGD